MEITVAGKDEETDVRKLLYACVSKSKLWEQRVRTRKAGFDREVQAARPFTPPTLFILHNDNNAPTFHSHHTKRRRGDAEAFDGDGVEGERKGVTPLTGSTA